MHAETKPLLNVSDDALVIIGKFGAPHGVRGWSKVTSFTDPEVNIVNYPEWWVGKKGAWRLQKKLAQNANPNKLTVLMEGIHQREDASLLTGQWIAVLRDALPPTDEGEYYWTDLTGCEVQDETGRDLGRVDHLVQVGETDVMVVTLAGKQQMIPFRQGDVVKKVDLALKKIIVCWEWV